MRYTILFTLFLLSSCSWWRGEGQVVFHWERERTGVSKFARDHSECLREAEGFLIMPDISSWLYSEEYRYNIVVDWHKDKGIWASYVPYPGAVPLMVNSIRDTSSIDPDDYSDCMERKGYWHRSYDIPEITNLFIYKPQKGPDRTPFEEYYRK